MRWPPMVESENLDALLDRAASGDVGAVTELFERFRKRLKRMVALRLNRRILGRLDDSDVLQEACLEAAKRLPDFLRDRPLPFYLWLRHITGQKLIDVHRRHMGAQMRDAACELSLHRGAMPMATSVSLARQLLGRLSSPSAAATKAELRLRIQAALNEMDPLDREILALRHFEQMSNAEVATALELNESTASTRYLRALKRLKTALGDVHELFG